MSRALRRTLSAIVAVGALVAPSTVNAENFPVGGGTILGFGSAYATGAEVFIQYLGFEAEYTDELHFAIGWGGTQYFLFTNQGADAVMAGDVFRLNDYVTDPLFSGFTAGDEVLFALYVEDAFGGVNEDRWYFTGDPARNLDGLHHAKWATYEGSGMYDGETIEFDHQVGFEDILGGGDGDFDDMVFATYGVEVVPEPMSMLLLATGLMGIAGVAYRRRNDEVESSES